ncbi:MAG: phosphatidylinositol-specific phospholipase C/glycerophosphodiester phosphodiesterase family protein [Candidatus Ventricola sp.]|nr:phosphatidylinositol-specific phospholipase C/glycerophosphodiester phosphodiesterase family protein [Candidatus Ventricola sp.]
MLDWKHKKSACVYAKRIAWGIFLLLILLAGALAVRKAYSLYLNLCRKMDYVCDMAYTVDKNVKSIRQNVNNIYSKYEFDYAWAENQHLIAHAFGEIDGQTYTNTYDAFLHNYSQGHRVFEVDFDVTVPENTLVASHDAEVWREKTGNDATTPFTYENFINSRVSGQYMPMDYRDVIEMMIEYPDIYIVTDTKYQDQMTIFLQFSQLVKYAQERDENVLKRIIPQIYHEEMLGQIMSVYPFESVIFTLYATAWTPESVVDFCERTGVGFITMPIYAANESFLALLESKGILAAAHTGNDREEAERLFSTGLDMMYTDHLKPDEFSEMN